MDLGPLELTRSSSSLRTSATHLVGVLTNTISSQSSKVELAHVSSWAHAELTRSHAATLQFSFNVWGSLTRAWAHMELTRRKLDLSRIGHFPPGGSCSSTLYPVARSRSLGDPPTGRQVLQDTQGTYGRVRGEAYQPGLGPCGALQAIAAVSDVAEVE